MNVPCWQDAQHEYWYKYVLLLHNVQFVDDMQLRQPVEHGLH
jgi:hypothetical protein